MAYPVIAGVCSIIALLAWACWWEHRRKMRELANPYARQPAIPHLTTTERRVLCAMSADRPTTANQLVAQLNLPIRQVTEARQSLAQKHLAKHGPAFNDNGKVSGGSYRLTEAGEETVAWLQANKRAA